MTSLRKGLSLVFCQCCCRKRQVRNCVRQVYYDGMEYWCAEGKGCKPPRVNLKRERQMRQRRSDGQKRRWAKVRREEP